MKHTDYEYLFFANRSLLNLGREIIGDAKEENIKTTLYRFLVAFFCVKAYFTSYSIYKLCKEKMGPDSAILLRSLFEIWINFEYILKDPDKLSEKYWKFESLEKKRLVEQLNKSQEWIKLLGQTIKEKENDIKKLYNAVKSDYDDEYKWSGKSISEMIRNIDPDFIPLYSILSSIVHSQPSAATADYLRDDSLDIDLNKNLNFVPQALSSTYSTFLFILEKFNEVFNLKNEEKLKKARKRINKFSKYCK